MTTSTETTLEEALVPSESSTAVEGLKLPLDSNFQTRLEESLALPGRQNHELVSTDKEYLFESRDNYSFYYHRLGNDTLSFITLPDPDVWTVEHPVDVGNLTFRADWNGASIIESGPCRAVYGDTSYDSIWPSRVSRLNVPHLGNPGPGTGKGYIKYTHLLGAVVCVQEIHKESEHAVEFRSADRLPFALDGITGGYGWAFGSDTGLKGHILGRKEIRSAMERAFRDGSQEVFEYGMESVFSRTLDALIRRHSNDAVAELGRILVQEQADLEVKEEALLRLGSIEHNPTHQSRLWLLTKHLQSDLVSVRDAAALGIAAMDDPSAIPYLRYAVQVEKSDRLRRDLQLVLDQLVDTRGCQTS